MPRVQFSHPTAGKNLSAPMPAPKSIGDTQAWLRQARKVIPDIPLKISNHRNGDGWWIREAIIDTKLIILHLERGDHRDRAAVIFDRNYCTISNRSN